MHGQQYRNMFLAANENTEEKKNDSGRTRICTKHEQVHLYIFNIN